MEVPDFCELPKSLSRLRHFNPGGCLVPSELQQSGYEQVPHNKIIRWLRCCPGGRSSGWMAWGSFVQSKRQAVFKLSVIIFWYDCLFIITSAFISPAASSFSFCRPAVEYRALPEDFKHQLSRRTGGNLTWHDGRGQKTAGGRAVKLLQQPGTEALQVLNIYTWHT